MSTNASRHTSARIEKAEEDMRSAFADLVTGPEDHFDDNLAKYNAAVRTLGATRSPHALRALESNVWVANEVISKLETKEDTREVANGAINKRSAARGRIKELAEEIRKATPNLTPAEAFAKALASEEGQAIRARYHELPAEERVPVSKGRFIEAAEAAENRPTHPAVT